MENPDLISEMCWRRFGCEDGFEILSIDIADVDVGRNIGPSYRSTRRRPTRISQAKAAERRFAALARNRRCRPGCKKMRAHVVEAEAEVPKAMAKPASGGLVIDYYQLQNIKADTSMQSPSARWAPGPPLGNRARKRRNRELTKKEK